MSAHSLSLSMRRLGLYALVEVPALVALLWSLRFLALFWPGNLSVDSFWQYDQATSGQFSDHHPPVMAVLLRLVLELGGGIGILVALQWIAGLGGLYALSHTFARLSLRRLPAHGQRMAANCVVLLIVSPLTPLSFYLVTFWKDSWVCAGLPWAIASLMWLLRPELTRVRPGLALAVFLVSSLLTELARHNAVILVPVFALLLGLAVRHRGVVWALAAGALQLSVFFAVDRGINVGFDVERRYLGNATLLRDVLASCGHDCPDYASWWATKGELNHRFYRAFDVRLWEEWKRLYANHPVALAKTKVRTYSKTLNLRKGPINYIQGAIDPSFERAGIAQDPAGRARRDALVEITEALARHRMLRPLLGSHAPWFLLAIAGVFAVSLRALETRTLPRESLAGLVPFAAALAYYLSYLPVWTSGDFRYMYPATLICQVVGPLVVVAFAAGSIRVFAHWKASRRAGPA